MAITDRQAAAIRRRKADAAAARRAADEHARVGHLMGFDADPDIDADTVGWFQKAGTTLKGVGHLCRRCSPERPLGYFAVNRSWLAATMPCTRCGTKLETVTLGPGTGNR